MYVRMYVCMYTYMFVCIHTYICMYMYMYMCLYIHTYTGLGTHTRVCVYRRPCMRGGRGWGYICTCVCWCACISIYMHTCMHTSINVCIHAHIHMCKGLELPTPTQEYSFYTRTQFLHRLYTTALLGSTLVFTTTRFYYLGAHTLGLSTARWLLDFTTTRCYYFGAHTLEFATGTPSILPLDGTTIFANTLRPIHPTVRISPTMFTTCVPCHGNHLYYWRRRYYSRHTSAFTTRVARMLVTRTL